MPPRLSHLIVDHLLMSKFEIQRDGQTAESWAGVLSQFSDANIYQTWAYGEVRWGAGNLSHLTLKRDGVIVAAAQLRIARLPLVPAGIAYLRWGPLCHCKGEKLDMSPITTILKALRDEYCGRRGLTLQIIPNAFPDDARGVLLQEAFALEGWHAEAGGSGYRTVLVDLAPPPEVMRKQLDQKWRNQLNRSEKNGLELEVSDSREAYREFMGLYDGMWERKRFETSVDVDEFFRMQDLLSGTARMQVFTAKHGGASLGALVCSQMGDTAIYLLGATNEKGRELKASYFLQWQAMLWLRERGASTYDLGGIDPGSNPGGYHFKSGFGGREATQLPLHARSGGALSDAMIRGMSWLRRRRNATAAAGVAGH